MNASELVDHALELLLAKDMRAFAGLWAETGVIEFPFAPPGYPPRVEGRAAIEEYLRDYPDILDIREFPQRVVHRTADPEVVIAEFEAAGFVVRTGEPYRMRYVAVITVRDGRIQNYRDYWNPLDAAAAMGGLEELTGAFAGGARD
ncbi:ketosteroid isomerase-like protein [Thermocatellispora tengchongensis]|uniref:Ketosteroid isomerase-like protein n=1 Tax=Thermocatellispora tengchongensis TaxID=1073253 RepID=A0A840P8N9_9ACTN|nr:nuclear transport factor 2 family protein [Thermocatellispora tengchongensis]MBB5133577.1 ketosteroid isomerase-like protein [Thermocatellispora tengchongensis]